MKIFSAQKTRKKPISKQNRQKKKASQYEKKLTEIAPIVKDMGDSQKYSADPEKCCRRQERWKRGNLTEKEAKPLIKNIVAVLRSIYQAYLDLSEDSSDMKSYERA